VRSFKQFYIGTALVFLGKDWLSLAMGAPILPAESSSASAIGDRIPCKIMSVGKVRVSIVISLVDPQNNAGGSLRKRNSGMKCCIEKILFVNLQI
jgi:hypothetical protein